MGHMAGIATRTNAFVKMVKGTKAVILDTRKTLPGLRSMEKRAVTHGGGKNHRFSLFRRCTVEGKPHCRAGGIKKALLSFKRMKGKMNWK